MQASACVVVMGVGVVSSAFGTYSALFQIVESLSGWAEPVGSLDVFHIHSYYYTTSSTLVAALVLVSQIKFFLL